MEQESRANTKVSARSSAFMKASAL